MVSVGSDRSAHRRSEGARPQFLDVGTAEAVNHQKHEQQSCC